METRFNVDLGRLVALLPFGMRSASVCALLRAGFAPYTQRLAATFRAARAADHFRLRQNGQVCYLRAALNERFRSALPGVRFEIGEFGIEKPWLYAHEETTPADPLTVHTLALTEPEPTVEDPDPHNHNAPRVSYPPFEPPYAPSEVQRNELHSFVIYVPSDLYYASLPAVRRFVEQYRLVTRTPQYEPINS